MRGLWQLVRMRPHGRRGHWRQLRAPVYKEQRRVWVRRTWVGPQTWEAEGQRYRVLAPAAERVEGEHARVVPKAGSSRFMVAGPD